MGFGFSHNNLFPAKDYFLETALLFHGVDWLQTREIVKDSRYTESNPVLGKNPSLKQVNVYMASTALILTGIHEILPVSLKQKFRFAWMFNNAVYVTSNLSLGVRINL